MYINERREITRGRSLLSRAEPGTVENVVCLPACLPACLLFSITFSLSPSLSPFSLSPDHALDEVAMKYGNACNGILRSVACAYQEVILKRSCITGKRIERPSTSAT